MHKNNWKTYSLGLSLALAASTASAAITDWEYIADSSFIINPGAVTYTGGLLGCRYRAADALAWGPCPTGVPLPGGPAQPGVAGRSGIGISDRGQTGTVSTNGPAEMANTYTHYNNVVEVAYSTLSSATLQYTLQLRPAGSDAGYETYSFAARILFVETPNGTDPSQCVVADGQAPCSDIWVFEDLSNHSLYLDGREYTINYFLENNLEPLPPAVCAAAYRDNEPEDVPECFGFTTVEDLVGAVRMMFNLEYIPPQVTVAGRVYAEGSAPANTQDNGSAVDPGVLTQVSIQCTEPAYSAGPITTNADGTFSFTEVPAEANCTLTSTPPSAYQAAYLQQGTTGAAGGGGALDTSVLGSTATQSIAIEVPLDGSSGNLFALRPLTDMQSTTSCTPNPAAADATVSCTTVCTNSGASTAINASCSILNAAALPGNPAPQCDSPANLSAGAALTCSVSFTMPASGSVSVSGGTSADNDSNGGVVPTAGNNPSSATVSLPGQGPVTPTTPTPVPTLGALAFMLLSGLLGLAGLLGLRRRSAHHQA